MQSENELWSFIIIDELISLGITNFCFSPGSRSTPLIMEIARRQDELNIYTVIDERSAGFFALGQAKITKKPTVLISTSGTAVANYFPAVIESKYDQVPLIILSADRPHELRDTGANQTIDQIKLFGDKVLKSIDLIPPNQQPTARIVKHLRKTIDWCIHVSTNERGSIHINIPFRKPLEPQENNSELYKEWKKKFSEKILAKKNAPLIDITPVRNGVYADRLDPLRELLETRKNGLIICGRVIGGEMDFQQIETLGLILGFPILVDPLSNLKFRDSSVVKTVDPPLIIGGYETFLSESRFLDDIEIALIIGKNLVSKRVNSFLEDREGVPIISINEIPFLDPSFSVSHVIEAPINDFVRHLIFKMQKEGHVPKKQWVNKIYKAEEIVNKALTNQLENVFDGSIVAKSLELLKDSIVFAANSLAIRHIDQFCKVSRNNIQIHSNRGASGIDGNLSTALGISVSTDTPVLAIIGDLAMLHDLNSLSRIKKFNSKIKVLILNNNGGGIFKRLPIGEFTEEFTEYFQTPVEINFEQISNAFGLNYVVVKDFKSLETALKQEGPLIMEFKSDLNENDKRQKEFEAIVVAEINKEFE